MKKIIRLISVVLVVVFLMTMLSVVASAAVNAACSYCGSQRVTHTQYQTEEVIYVQCPNSDTGRVHKHFIDELWDKYYCQECHYVSNVYSSYLGERCEISMGNKK